MQIIREKEIQVNGKKEIVRVTFDIPSSVFKTKEQATEEFGDIGMGDRTTEQILDEAFGTISSSLVSYTIGTLHCGGHFGDALMILQTSILNSGAALACALKSWKEDEKMS